MNSVSMIDKKRIFTNHKIITVHFNSMEQNSIPGYESLNIDKKTIFGCKYSDIIKSEDVINDIKKFVKEMFIDYLHPNCYQYSYSVYVSGLEIYNSSIDDMCSIIAEDLKQNGAEL